MSLVDLVATLVDAGGATPPAPLSGESLLPLANGDPAGGAWKDEAFCAYLAHGVAGPMAMLRRGRYKLNVSLGDEPELYDLEADPKELNDVAGANPEVVKKVLEVMRTARVRSSFERWNFPT